MSHVIRNNLAWFLGGNGGESPPLYPDNFYVVPEYSMAQELTLTTLQRNELSGTFERSDVPLVIGPNTISVTATDGLENSISRTTVVHSVEFSGLNLEIVLDYRVCPDVPIKFLIHDTQLGLIYEIFGKETSGDDRWDLIETGIPGADGTTFWVNCNLNPKYQFFAAAIADDPDGDGLGSGYEILVLRTSPDIWNSDFKDKNDGDEDFDNDGLSSRLFSQRRRKMA